MHDIPFNHTIQTEQARINQLGLSESIRQFNSQFCNLCLTTMLWDRQLHIQENEWGKQWKKLIGTGELKRCGIL